MNDHKIDWDNARIVATEKMTASRLHLESIIILTTFNTVNCNDGNLNPIYSVSKFFAWLVGVSFLFEVYLASRISIPHDCYGAMRQFHSRI